MSGNNGKIEGAEEQATEKQILDELRGILKVPEGENIIAFVKNGFKVVSQSEAKTEEQLDKERTERFTKDPYSFIEINELICGVIRNPKSQLGISILLNTCKRSELNNAQVELVHRMELARRSMDIEAQMRQEAAKKLVVPGMPPKKHGVLDFVRGR